MGLELLINTTNEQIIIEMSGDLDIYTSPDFNKQVLVAFEKDEKDLLFRADKLDYIDSTGLGAFISVYKIVQEKGKSLKITDLKANVKKIFVITELDKIFKIEGKDE
ncbi:MAG: STAS domain-containing protein [Tissierellia bacterium]|nr:STAS domain-containing protein [Tissierellia bacterium]